MKILIVGQGGREHTIAWKIAQSPRVNKIFVAPGNAGTSLESKTKNINISANNIPELLKFALSEKIDLTIIGPEAPLVAGVVDQFREQNLTILGPCQAAAKLEGSKAFCKEILTNAGIPTANYGEFTDLQQAKKYLANNKPPYVIKADGLAAGKGVVITDDINQAIMVLKDFMSGRTFGQAGKKVIIEDFLIGQEASFIALISNDTIIPFASSQDHKARDNNDQGPNTGGMGAYSPAPLVTEHLYNNIIKKVIEPTITELKKQHIDYNGFLYAGLMIDKNNNFKVLEYNCRLGDPETQVILPRLDSDFFELCYAAASNNLINNTQINWINKSAVTVVLASKNYPNTPVKNEIITGLTNNNLPSDICKIFHAATVLDKDNNILTSGGRVLTVTALADTLQAAQDSAYHRIKSINWPHLFYRTDIGAKAL